MPEDGQIEHGSTECCGILNRRKAPTRPRPSAWKAHETRPQSGHGGYGVKNGGAMMLSDKAHHQIVEHGVRCGLPYPPPSNGTVCDANDRHGCLASLSRSLAIVGLCRLPDRPESKRRTGPALHDSGKVMHGPGSSLVSPPGPMPPGQGLADILYNTSRVL
jgi:hypothetical protein